MSGNQSPRQKSQNNKNQPQQQLPIEQEAQPMELQPNQPPNNKEQDINSPAIHQGISHKQVSNVQQSQFKQAQNKQQDRIQAEQKQVIRDEPSEHQADQHLQRKNVNDLEKQPENMVEEEGQVSEQAKASPAQQVQRKQINEGYINSLQSKLQNKSKKLQQTQNKLHELTSQFQSLKETNKKLRFDYLSSKQEISKLHQQNTALEKKNTQLTGDRNSLQLKVKQYQEAGDVSLYKQKITQMEKFLALLKEELQAKETLLNTALVGSAEKTQLAPVQALSMLDEIQAKNKQLVEKNIELMHEFTQCKKHLEATEEELQQVRREKMDAFNRQYSLKDLLKESEQKCSLLEKEIIQKTKQYERQLLSVSRKDIIGVSSSQEKSRVQKNFGINILQPQQERDMILREYILQEQNLKTVKADFHKLKQRHYNLLQGFKQLNRTHIPKKQFSDLYQRYVKLRNCLEESLASEENLKNQVAQLRKLKQINSENLGVNASQNPQLVEEKKNGDRVAQRLGVIEPQDPLIQVNKVLQKPSQKLLSSYSAKEQLHLRQRLFRAQKHLKEKEEKTGILRQQNQQLKNVLSLYEKEISYLKNQVVLLGRHSQGNLKQLWQNRKEGLSAAQKHQLFSTIDNLRGQNEVLTVKSLELVRECSALKAHNDMINELYANLKTMHEELVSKQPQMQVIQPQNSVQQEKQDLTQQNKSCLSCQQREKRVQLYPLADLEVQTQGLGELYYKQIKELLMVLRKFPKRVDKVTSDLEQEKEKLEGVKQAFEVVSKQYQTKSKNLQEQKKANSVWRSQQKELIREEFQDIRELLMNQRLLKSLRQAKSLIESYEENLSNQNEEKEKQSQNNQGKEQPEGQELKNGQNSHRIGEEVQQQNELMKDNAEQGNHEPPELESGEQEAMEEEQKQN